MYSSHSYLSYHEALNERFSASFGNTGNLGREIGSVIFKGADDVGSVALSSFKEITGSGTDGELLVDTGGVEVGGDADGRFVVSPVDRS
jgi:hypothetical protein